MLDQVTSGSSPQRPGHASARQPGQTLFPGFKITNVVSVNYAIHVDFDITPLEEARACDSHWVRGGVCPARFQLGRVSTQAQAVIFAIDQPFPGMLIGGALRYALAHPGQLRLRKP